MKGVTMKKTEVECCDTFCIHEELVHKAEGHIPDEEVLKDLADFFKVFADTTRMKLVKNRREGKTVFYSLADDHIQTIMNQGMEHILE